MQILLNGETYDYNGLTNINALLDDIGANKDHTALMLNGSVIPSDNWEDQEIKENDEVEVLVFVGGGLCKTILTLMRLSFHPDY